jgi:hypothetical protein
MKKVLFKVHPGQAVRNQPPEFMANLIEAELLEKSGVGVIVDDLAAAIEAEPDIVAEPVIDNPKSKKGIDKNGLAKKPSDLS